MVVIGVVVKLSSSLSLSSSDRMLQLLVVAVVAVFQLRSQCTLGPIKINHKRKIRAVNKHWESPFRAGSCITFMCSSEFYRIKNISFNSIMLPAEWTWISSKTSTCQGTASPTSQVVGVPLSPWDRLVSSYRQDLDCTQGVRTRMVKSFISIHVRVGNLNAARMMTYWFPCSCQKLLTSPHSMKVMENGSHPLRW